MAAPTQHAVCSASSSERWLHCTAAPRFEEQFPPSSSTYAEEGHLAHSICELYGRKRFTVMRPSEFEKELQQLKADPLFQPEMLTTAQFYVQYLEEKINEFPAKPFVAFEIKVDFSDYVPEGFGTCDCAIIGGDTLRITDYKHGKGVFVSSVNNSQMRLYALGALKFFSAVYGDTIENVVMAIVQPRISEDVTEERMTVEELRAWGDAVRDKARRAYSGIGATFEPGDWCRFCRGKAVCKARAKKNCAFEDFKDCIPTGKASPEQLTQAEEDGRDGIPTGVLSNAEVADLLVRAADLVKWYGDLKDYAQQEILAGREIPGWKVVAGKSVRAFTDTDAAFNAIRAAGYDDVMLYDRKPKTLAALEKLVGKKNFESIAGQFITRPMGAPTLVEASDPRSAYSPAAADFGGVSNG